VISRQYFHPVLTTLELLFCFVFFKFYYSQILLSLLKLNQVPRNVEKLLEIKRKRSDFWDEKKKQPKLALVKQMLNFWLNKG